MLHCCRRKITSTNGVMCGFSTFLEEGAASAAATRVGVCGGAAEHRTVVILLVGVAEIVVVVVVVDALPVLALPTAVPSQAPEFLFP